MKNQITVKKAIKRGYLMVNLPVFISLFAFPALGFYLYKLALIPDWGIAVFALIGFVVAWLVWSVMITKWRIWAFENVRNVHELRRKAVEENLIWPDGHFFEKTEIRSKADKIKLKELEKKFEREDEYKEDFWLPARMEIRFSKTSLYFEVGVSILIIAVGIYLLLPDKAEKDVQAQFLGALMLGLGLYNLVKNLWKLGKNQPQIIIDNMGVQSINHPFVEWSRIANEQVVKIGYGKSVAHNLTYYYYNEQGDDCDFEEINIAPLEVTPDEMENIIRTYRIRFNRENAK